MKIMRILGAAGLAFCLLTGAAFAQGVTRVCVESIGANGSNNCVDASATNPFPVTGSFSATVSGFAPGGSYATPLAVTNATGNVALPTGTTVVVYNVGANAAYVKLGTSNAVTATTSDDYIPAGGAIALTVGSNTYLAAITSSSTTTLNLSGGTGLATGWGGGSGGSGGTVTQGTAASSGPWIFTPWIAGAVNSATNGTYSDILQGNAVLSATNGLFSNILQGNAVLTGANPIFTALSIGGAVDSATNGIYANLLQGNAVVSASNPSPVQLSQGGAVLSASNGIPTQAVAGATGGATPYHLLSAATTNATNVKATAGTLYSLSLINTTATIYYLRLYDIATSAPTCSSATGVVENIPIPANVAGAGVVLHFGSMGMLFANGIGFCLTGGFSDTDTTNAATGVAVNLTYK